MSINCDCDLWKNNIDALNAGFSFMSTHGTAGYTGVIFKYCPWCAKELPEEKLSCDTCDEPDAKSRVDGGLAVGVYCDGCWSKMVVDCRSRSW